MLGLWKKFAEMPFWKRAAYGLPVAFACFWIALSLQAWAWTNVAVMQLENDFDSDIEFADTFFDFQGGFGATDVRLTKYAPNGDELGTFKIDRVTVQTPGIGWLFYNTVIDTTDELPDRFGIVLDNPRNLADDDSTPGNFTNLPFDAMGCTEALLTRTDLRAMDVPSARQVTLLLARDTDTESTGTLRLRTEGAGEMDIQVKIGLQRPVNLEQSINVMQAATLHNVQMTFNDLGFIEKRNAYCAKKHKLTAKAFSDYHMQEVARFSAATGKGFGPATLAQYRDFAENGGSLVLRTAGARKLRLVQFIAMPQPEQMRAYPIMIAANGKAPSNYSEFAVAPTQGAPAMPAAPAAVAAIPVAATQSVQAQPVVAGALPTPGSVVPPAGLNALVGQHVDVTTKYGSVRKGVLTFVGTLAINVQLDKEEGGLPLTMPTDSITSITYTPLAPPASAQQAKAP